MKYTREEIKKRIEELEYYINGFQWLSGRGVTVKNLRVRKDKAVADVIFHDYDDGVTERYNGCEYPYAKIFRE